ncbi:MAG: hypothetical protein IJ572_04810 [Bacilli bacterium]|nr:hypothetical protein [Bacilli bacterium]
MNKIKCYINSNYIDILKNNKIIHIVTDSIKNGDIIHSNMFIEDMKKNKLFSNILTFDVIIYLNHLIEERDLLYYKNIFEDLNAHRIIVKDTSSILVSPTMINCYPIYIVYFNNKYYKIDYKLLDSFLSTFNINRLKVISETKLSKNANCKYYYYNNYNTFFLR